MNYTGAALRGFGSHITVVYITLNYRNIFGAGLSFAIMLLWFQYNVCRCINSFLECVDKFVLCELLVLRIFCIVNLCYSLAGRATSMAREDAGSVYMTFFRGYIT